MSSSKGTLVRGLSVGGAVGVFPWFGRELVHIGEIIAAETVVGHVQNLSLEEPQMELLNYFLVAAGTAVFVICGMGLYSWMQSVDRRIAVIEEESRRRQA